jgi:hypothetical protein
VAAMRKRILIYRATPPQPKEVTEPKPHVRMFGKLIQIKESEIDHYEGFEIKYV